MANYYWVGGAGTWDNTVSNWRTTSGGATPAPNAPLATDTANFDGNSGTGAVTIASTATCATCNLGGSGIIATLNANHTTTFTTLNVTAGTFDCSTFNMSFGAGTVTVSGGTFSCNGGTITAGSLVAASGLAKTISLGSSTLNLALTDAINFTGTGLTFNAGTSQINCSAAGVTITGITAGTTFYNVAFTTASLTTSSYIRGANTFNNLTFAGRTSVGASPIIFNANQTVNGTLTVSTPTPIGISRYYFRSLTLGTTVTLTAAAVSLIDIDFRDITGAGAATWAGTRIGDCGGNSNITFDTPKTVYWNLAGSQAFSATGWATTQTGTPDNANFPLPQDTAVFTDTNPAAGLAITSNIAFNIGTLDFSNRTNTLTYSSGTNTYYGDIKLSSAITLSGTGTLTFTGRNKTQTITSSGKTFTQAISQTTIGGTLAFADAFTTSSSYTHTNGAISTNYNFTCTTFNSANSNTRSISLGSGQMYCTGTATVFTTATTTGLTVTGNPTINVTSTGATAITVTTGATVGVSNKFDFNFTGGTYALTLTNGNYFNNLNFTGFSGSLVNAGRFLYGDLTLSSTMTVAAGANATVFYGTSGIQTIITNGVSYNAPITFNGVGGTFRLGSALTMSGNGNITHTNGIFDLNGYTASCVTYITATGTKNLTFNGGSLVCTTTATAFNNAAPAGFTTTAGTGVGTISLTAATAKTFVGGGSTYNCTLNQGGAGALTITGNNTFNNITSTIQPVQPATVTFASGTTNIFNYFSLSGTAGNLITINSSTAGTRATISKSSGTVNVSYCSIQDSNATGGAIWTASTSNGNVDAGNNLGWNFAGGTTYNVDLTEAITAAEAVSAILDLTSSLAETLATADSQDVSGSTYNAQLTETGAVVSSQTVTIDYTNTLTETVVATETETASTNNVYDKDLTETLTADETETSAITANQSVTESVTATDIENVALSIPTTLTESVTVTDSQSALLTLMSYIIEAITGTDSQSSIQTAVTSITETSTATDEQSAAGSIYNAPITETLTAQDVMLGIITITSVVSESVTATATQQATIDILASIAEAAVAADSQSALVDLVASLIEVVTAVETTGAAGSIYNVSTNEIGSAQSTLSAAGSTFNVSLLESVLASDSYAGRLLWELINDIQNANWGDVSNSQNPVWAAINNAQNPNWVNVNDSQTPGWSNVTDSQNPNWTPINTFGTS